MIISEIKKESKIKLTGNYIKAVFITLLYIIITLLLDLISNTITNNFLQLCYLILISIISLPLSYGFVACMIKISRQENVSLFDFVTLGLNDFSKVWKIFGRMLLKLFLPLLLILITFLGFNFCILMISFNSELFNSTLSQIITFIIPLILLIISLVYLIAKSLLYSLSYYILYDNQNYTSKQIVEKSEELMKGNRLNYLLLMISFIGWYLLISLIGVISSYFINPTIIVLICSIMLSPYIYLSLVTFYENLVFDKNQTDNKVENME